MAFVELLRVAAIQQLEAARERVPRGVKDEVVMRGHQAEGVDRPVEPLDASPEMSEELAAVGVVAKDGAPVDATSDHVEVPVGKQHARQASHDSMKPDEERMASQCGQIGTLLSPAHRPARAAPYEIEVGWYVARKSGP